MKFIAWIFLLLPILASANGIDDNCKKLTYMAAPVVQADQYICHTQYAVAYSYAHKNPIYTTEFLSKDHTGKLPRTNDFRVDPAVPTAYRATPADYVKATCNGGRCDRGHMTPDQDFSACAVCVSESFFMTNMVPQNYKNNEVIWKAMEMKIRAYVATGHSVYVITGPIYMSKTPATIGSSKVSVPDMLFKIVIDSATGKSIAFLMPNADLPSASLPQRTASISEIESMTNIVFEKSLDKRSVAVLTDWQ